MLAAGELPARAMTETGIHIGGEGPVGAQAIADCYHEIRRIAHRLVNGEADRMLIQPTELAHEAAIRLLRLDRMQFADRGHLLATAARLARQVLLDEVRRARAGKRIPVPLTLWPSAVTPVPLAMLDRAVAELALVSPDYARIVELRFTLGMTVEETAAAAGLSPRTVKRQWAAARTWLQTWLEAEEDA